MQHSIKELTYFLPSKESLNSFEFSENSRKFENSKIRFKIESVQFL